MNRIEKCVCCGSSELHQPRPVIWPELAEQWELSDEERAVIDRQQGFGCGVCGSNLRSMALAFAIIRMFGNVERTFVDFTDYGPAPSLRLLEVNESGTLFQWFDRWPKRTLVRHPEVDMQALPFEAGSFDLVIHSDTLEHVPDPVKGLSECRRVLSPAGACIFTVPTLPGRLSRSRAAMEPSYHGSPSGEATLVHTEFGADTWKYAIEAGFRDCSLTALEWPAGLAWTATR